VVLWELLTCETPYRDVDYSAVIWGVGTNALHLPIPKSCPEGFRLLVRQCWSAKPRNRPSFKHILLHLEIAAVQVLNTTPQAYFDTQVSFQINRSKVVAIHKPLQIYGDLNARKPT